MNAERQLLLERLFHETLALPAEQQHTFLTEHCPDPELRLELESLLLHAPLSGLDTVRDAIRDTASAIGKGPQESASMALPAFGVYQAIGLLGEGGMGIVYLAEQGGPIRRRVALKVLKHGNPASSVLARFKAESQLLAMLDHSSIAQVYDAGTTATGQLYFAMEYVPGISIIRYCDRNLLVVPDRLKLFRQVCLGVHYAHEKGIIHRDLKPSNVLVMLQDGKPSPKIIDFGVAKAIDPQGIGRTLFTEIGVLIGTPEYMSPEQADFTGLEVDSRTDIYSLGVLLYELLVGALPFNNEILRQAGYAEIQRTIREDQPPLPSSRLDRLGDDDAHAAARQRQTDLRGLRRVLKGDLQTIVMKALAKDRLRRYESALEFATDIGRYLAHQPVAAQPPGLAYQARMFLKRQRRTLYACAAAILLAALTGFFFWWRTPEPVPRILAIHQLTNDASSKYGLVTDGSRLYFTKDLQQIVAVSVTGGEVKPLVNSLPSPLPVATAPDSSALLVVAGTPHPSSGCFLCFQLWSVPFSSGVPHKLADLEANDATYFPDGEHILYGSSQGIAMAGANAQNQRLLVRVDSPVRCPRLSPDRRHIRFFRWEIRTDSMTLWDSDINGHELHQMLTDWPELSNLGHSSGSGNWTPDGRYFVFGAEREGRVDLWALPEKRGLFNRRSSAPVRLTNGPMSYSVALPSRDGTSLFALATTRRGELARFDSSARAFVPFLAGVSANEIVFSRDGKWAVYTTYPDHSLWRSRLDGSERLRLTDPPLEVYRPQVSPDGARAAFYSVKPTADVYVVAMQGGTPQLVQRDAFSPVWSPDGDKLAVAAPASIQFETRVLDLRTGTVNALSQGQLKCPVSWSPDNRLVAVNLAHTQVLSFDFPTLKWSPLLNADISERNMFDGSPSVDGRYLYVETNEKPHPKVIRISLSDGRVEPVMQIGSIRRVVDPSQGTTLGVAPDGSVLVTRDVGVEEVYSLTVKWP